MDKTAQNTPQTSIPYFLSHTEYTEWLLAVTKNLFVLQQQKNPQKNLSWAQPDDQWIKSQMLILLS